MLVTSTRDHDFRTITIQVPRPQADWLRKRADESLLSVSAELRALIVDAMRRDPRADERIAA